MANKRLTRKNKTNFSENSVLKRGRPTGLHYDQIYGRTQNFQFIFNQVWDRFWPLFANAGSEDEVLKAFQDGAKPYSEQFVPYAALALETKNEATFPKRAISQQRFLADSLAALGDASARRSRDICMQERMKKKRAHHIIRFEYYVECSCGYEGPAKDRACRKCNAPIPPTLYD